MYYDKYTYIVDFFGSSSNTWQLNICNDLVNGFGLWSDVLRRVSILDLRFINISFSFINVIFILKTCSYFKNDIETKPLSNEKKV